jgi:hypothetical protein
MDQVDLERTIRKLFARPIPHTTAWPLEYTRLD